MSSSRPTHEAAARLDTGVELQHAIAQHVLLQLIDQRAFGLGHGLVDGDGQTVLPRSRCFAQPVTLHARFCAPRSFSLHAVTVIDLESRRVHIAGLVRDPHAAWIQQIARNLTASVDGFLRGKRYLIHDRDPLFTAAFRANLCAAGIECLKLPLQSPNLNSFAERFVLSIKKECLSKLVPLGARHLRFVISEFVAHYHLERNHQGLDNRLITAIAAPANDNADPAAPIERRQRLGGLLSYYCRPAA